MRLLLSLLLLAAAPTVLHAQTTFTVTVANKTAAHPYAGQGHPQAYLLNGAEAPPVTLVRGATYTFQMSNVSGVHPFYLSTSSSGSGAGVWSPGVTGNFASGNAALTFTVPASAPDVLWYQCSSHDFMGWQMNIVDGGEAFAAVLSGANEVPANSSPAGGRVTATLTGSTLVVGGSFSGLVGTYSVSHLHTGLAGQSGSVAVNLAPTVAPDGRSGTFEAAANTFALTPEQVAALRARRLYVNVHSSARPAGELRAQLAPAAAVPYRVLVTAAEEVPTNGSAAQGSLLAELDGTTLTVSGAFGGLGSAYTASHLHAGLAGRNGPVLFNLTPTVATDGRGGAFEAAANTFTLTPEQVAAVQARGLYVNIHSQGRPGGEIRGQVTPAAWVGLRAALTGRAEVPANPSQATGLAIVEVRGTELRVSGSFAGLGSDFNTAVGAHLHVGGTGTNGPVVFPLAVALDADGRGGRFEAAANTFAVTAEQAALFAAGGYYVNVHSVGLPAGEVRGQVLAAPNLAPAAPAITSPGDGATVRIEGDGTTPFVVTWSASDPNANPLSHSWQLSQDAAFTQVVLEAATGGAARFETTFSAVDNLLASLGVPVGGQATLFHRARTRDGSFGAAGTPATVTLQRSGPVADEGGAEGGAFALGRVSPNPFSGRAVMTLTLPEAATVTADVFDLLGRRVLGVEAVAAPAGRSSLALDARALSAGTYVVRVRAEGATQVYTASQRMVRAD